MRRMTRGTLAALPLLAFVLALAAPSPARSASLVQVTGFGTNPTNLTMHLYVPDSLQARPPLLLALHYCTGSGTAFFSGTEWRSAADRYGFIVIYPSATRSGQCWDVSSASALRRDGGSDPVGLRSMISYVQSRYPIDASRVFVTGASSGAMMTNVMLGDYPDVFAAGAAFMGVPFGCFATTDGSGWNSQCANGQISRTAQQWGDAVRNAYPGYSGPRPRMQLWHGTTDSTLNYNNFGEEIKQWTNVLGLSQTPSFTDTPQSGWTRTRYGGTGAQAPVEAYSLAGTGHSMMFNGQVAYAVTYFGLDQSGTTYALGVTKAGTGSGTVTSTTGGINCGSTCSANIASGTAVTLNATAAAGSTFAGWGGACTGSGSCIVTMTAARTVTATFDAANPGGPISINAGGSATGSFVADVAYSGGSTYSTTSAIDTSLVPSPVPPQAVFQSERYGEFSYTIPGLTAGSGYAVTLYFAETYWTAAGQRTFNVSINGSAVLTAFDIFAAAGGANKALARTFDATANASGQVVVQFARGGGPDNPKICGIAVEPRDPGTSYTLSVTRSGSGTVTSSPGGIDCGSTCSASVASGTAVTLTATPASGSTFSGWGGACTGSGTCIVTMTAAQSVTATFTGTVPSGGVLINAGGAATGSYVADAYYSGGTAYTNSNTVDVSGLGANAPPAAVFQSERYGAFTYTIPNLTAGAAYTVTLYFAETYLTAAGRRLFGVAINGATALSSFDIYAAAGGQNKAIARSFTATATSSGQIVVQFVSGTENPKVNAIAVTTGGAPDPVGGVSLNAGGAAVGSYAADAYFSGGTAYTNTNTVDVSGLGANAPPAAVFQSERYGAFTYTIPSLTAGAAYTVRLYFAETYHTAAGRRVFGVTINGASALSGFDIYASAGGQNRAIARSFNATASASGQLVIQFVSGTENPKVNAISVTAGASADPDPDPEPTFNPCPTSGDCKVLPLGDSITDGFNVAGGYRIELFRRARAGGKRMTFVGSLVNGPSTVDGVAFPRNHEGHSGWTIEQIAGLVPSPATSSSPHVVLLMAGTNDMYGTGSGAPQRLDALLGKLVSAAPNALIVVAQLTPLSDSGRAALVRTYNGALPAIVNARRAQGQHIVLVDMHTGFPNSELADGTHPNAAGYARMAGVWYSAISSYLH